MPSTRVVARHRRAPLRQRARDAVAQHARVAGEEVDLVAGLQRQRVARVARAQVLQHAARPRASGPRRRAPRRATCARSRSVGRQRRGARRAGGARHRRAPPARCRAGAARRCSTCAIAIAGAAASARSIAGDRVADQAAQFVRGLLEGRPASAVAPLSGVAGGVVQVGIGCGSSWISSGKAMTEVAQSAHASPCAPGSNRQHCVHSCHPQDEVAPMPDRTITVALLAMPDVTAATLYGFYDALAGAERDWQLLHGARRPHRRSGRWSSAATAARWSAPTACASRPTRRSPTARRPTSSASPT